jgi:hypothetical protein
MSAEEVSALKSGPVPVLDPFGLEPRTEPVLIITKIHEPWTGLLRTGPHWSFPVLRPVTTGSEPDLVPTSSDWLGPPTGTT